jgi:hypothetical protein
MTALQYITRAMRTVGGVASGEAVSAAEAADGLTILNAMIDSWRLQRLLIFFSTETIYPIVAGLQTYTIGPTGSFVQARPVTIERASSMDYTTATAPLELPLEILTDQQWQQIPVKTTSSKLFTRLRYRLTDPNGTIELWPVPTSTLVKLKLYTPSALTAFIDLATNYVVAPGYEEAIVYNLAKRYAPELGQRLSPEVNDLAIQSLKWVRLANITLEELVIDPAILARRQSFDWRTG